MKWLLILLVLAGLFMAGSWVYRFTAQPAPTPLPVISATIYPLYDVVRQVAGTKVEVTLLVPPGTDPKIATSSAAPTYAIGHGLDNVESPVVVDANSNLFPDNPYYYLSLKNAPVIINNIAADLTTRFPEKSAEFNQNAADLIAKIEALDQQAALWASASTTKALTAPKEWAYIAADYNLTFKEGSSSAFLDPFGGSIATDTYLNLMESNLKQLFKVI